MENEQAPAFLFLIIPWQVFGINIFSNKFKIKKDCLVIQLLKWHTGPMLASTYRNLVWKYLSLFGIPSTEMADSEP